MSLNVKIYLDDLKQKNLLILTTKLNLTNSEVLFLGEDALKDFSVDLKVNFIPESLVLVEGFIFANMLKPCDKCLEEYILKLKISFYKEYFIEDLDEKLDIDLSEDLREEFWLNIPLVCKCSETCKGLCSGCGVNLNYEKCKCNSKDSKEIINKTNPFEILKKIKD